MAIVIFILIIIINLFRYFTHKQNTHRDYIIISMIIQTIPLGLGKSIYSFLENNVLKDGSDEIIGAFSNNVRIETEFIFIVILLLLGFSRIKRINYKKNGYLFSMIMLCIISFFNPLNTIPFSFLPLISILLQCLMLLILISSNFNKESILKGFFDAFLCIITFQLILTICYPILGMKSVAVMFKGEHGLTLAERRDINSAIGTFSHPGQLALFCVIILVFFTTTFLNNYKKKISLWMIGCSLFIIFFTYSRASYIVAILVISILYIYRINKKIFSIKNILLLILSLSFTAFIIYISPLAKIFLESDINMQYINRLNHIYAGIEIWKDSKIIGVGLNSHVNYMLEHLINVFDASDNDFLFFTRSPIHNIHIIVLAEAGIVGFILWLLFFHSRISLSLHNIKKAPQDISVNIMHTTCIGLLIVIFAYGCTGFSPFYISIFKLTIFILYLTKVSFSSK